MGEDLDQFAGLYGNHELFHRRLDSLIEKMAFERIKPDIQGPDILEMGFGDGVFTEGLIKNFGKSSVVDASAELLAKAKNIYGNKIITYKSYFEEFIPPSPFDTIFCTYVLEHVDDPVLCLQKSKQWLKSSGRVLVMVPNALSYHRELGVAMKLHGDVRDLGEADREIGHKRVYTPDEMERDLEKAGLKIQKNRNFFFKPLHYAVLQYCSELQIEGLFKMDHLIPNERRGALFYMCS